jgi:hypothetical protein
LLELERIVREQEGLITELYETLQSVYARVGDLTADLAARLGEDLLIEERE